MREPLVVFFSKLEKVGWVAYTSEVPQSLLHPSPKQAAERIGNDCLGFRLRLLDRVVTRVFDQELQAHGIRHTQLILLVALQRLGATSPNRLVGWLSIEKSTLSRNLNLLIQRELVRDLSQPGKRSHLVELTDAGASLVVEAVPAWQRGQEKALRLLGDDSGNQIRKIVRHYWQLQSQPNS